MRKFLTGLLIGILVLGIAISSYSDEVLSSLNEETDLPVLNELLRKLRKDINDIEISSQDIIFRGWEIADTADDDTTVVIKPGAGLHGSTLLTTTANTTLTFTAAGDWYDGAADNYDAGAGWCYIGYDTENFKLLGENPPDVDDSEGNNVAGATKYYFNNIASGSKKYWRVIGAVRLDTDEKIHASYAGFQRKDVWWYDVPVNMSTTLSLGAWTDASTQAKGDCSTLIPAISQEGIFGLHAIDNNAQDTGVWIRPNGATWATNFANGIYSEAAGSSATTIGGQRQCATDSLQKINYYNLAGDSATRIDVEGFIFDLR